MYGLNTCYKLHVCISGRAYTVIYILLNIVCTHSESHCVVEHVKANCT